MAILVLLLFLLVEGFSFQLIFNQVSSAFDRIENTIEIKNDPDRSESKRFRSKIDRDRESLIIIDLILVTLI